MEIKKRSVATIEESYDFAFDDRRGYEMIYTLFKYESEADKPEGAVQESLALQERYTNSPIKVTREGDIGYFNDVIYRNFDGSVGRQMDFVSFSPAISDFLKLEKETKEQIFRGLGSRAKSLLEKGLEEYKGHRD